MCLWGWSELRAACFGSASGDISTSDQRSGLKGIRGRSLLVTVAITLELWEFQLEELQLWHPLRTFILRVSARWPSPPCAFTAEGRSGRNKSPRLHLRFLRTWCSCCLWVSQRGCEGVGFNVSEEDGKKVTRWWWWFPPTRRKEEHFSLSQDRTKQPCRQDLSQASLVCVGQSN